MRKLQMFRAMIAAVVLCIVGTGAAEAVCTVAVSSGTNPASVVFDATKPSITQYEYKASFVPTGCDSNYSVETFLWVADARSNGLSVKNAEKTEIGGYFSTLNPVNSVPVAASLTQAINSATAFGQLLNANGSTVSISMYYNIDASSNFALFKPGLYQATVNVSVYIRNNYTNVAVPAGIEYPMTVNIYIQPTAWLDLSSNKLDFGELTYGGVAKDPIYVYAYTNVQYALSFKSDNGWFLKTSPKDTVGVGYTIDFSSPLWDPYSPVPRAYFNVGGTSVGVQGPKLTGKITTDPTLLPAGTYTDTLTITLDTKP